ncbi:MAG: helix-turn-helix transcriptional regulator [Pseudomonadota bacterium]
MTEFSILHWELNQHQPATRHYPKIIEYLGYCPSFQAEADGSVAGLLRQYRVCNGLSRKQVANLIGIDASTVASVETGRHKPTKRTVIKIERFLA